MSVQALSEVFGKNSGLLPFGPLKLVRRTTKKPLRASEGLFVEWTLTF
jgi:hypothetical protein